MRLRNRPFGGEILPGADGAPEDESVGIGIVERPATVGLRYLGEPVNRLALMIDRLEGLSQGVIEVDDQVGEQGVAAGEVALDGRWRHRHGAGDGVERHGVGTAADNLLHRQCTVLLPDRDEVVGCVYFKPTRPPRSGAVDVRSWVTAEHADLDKPLHEAVTRWLKADWPWPVVQYAPR